MSDNAKPSGQPRVTIVVSPRERFGMAQRSLDSIYAASDIPFDLVYVDAASPKYISAWLKTAAPAKGFKIVRVDRFVSPNEARNLGAAQAKTEFVVFIDNDVMCADGWLGALVKAADETGADVVAPLVCEGYPLHSRVHQATGTFTHDKTAFFATPPGKREFIDIMTHHGVPLAEVSDQLHRAQTDTCEFHGLMVRRSMLDKIGQLDEEMYATKEHIDFCIAVAHAGGKLVFEPSSVITYVFPTSKNPLTRDDLPYFLLRWSPVWQIRSLDHIQKKWGLKDGEYLTAYRGAENLNMRHYQGVVKPLIKKIPIVRRSWRLTQAAGRFLANHYNRKAEALAAQYEKQRAMRQRAVE